MRIAYISRRYLYCDILIEELRKEFKVDQFNYFREVKKAENYDVIFIESIGGDSLEASQRKLKKLIIMTRGVGVYEAKVDRIKWGNVDRLVGLSKHQVDYFKRRWGKKGCDPKNYGVLPVPAPLKEFPLKRDKRVNHSVALVANITDRKGTYQIPEFLERFPKLHIHHLGKVCLYGNPVREFVRWKLEKNKNTDRYHWQKHISFEEMNKWLEDKTYIWLPTISEGFNRSVVEGMCKGLKPIVRHFAGAEDIWMTESLYNRMDEIEKIINAPYEPERYRKYVDDRYNVKKIVKIFKEFL